MYISFYIVVFKLFKLNHIQTVRVRDNGDHVR